MSKKTRKQTVNSWEALKEVPEEIKKTLDQTGKDLMFDLWSQLLGGKDKNQTQAKGGDLKPGEEISLKEEKKVLHIEPGIDYSREIVHGERKIQAQSEHETKAKIQEILIEIKKLAASSRELQIEFKQITMEEVPQEAGKYHTAFVEWVLSLIRTARERVDTAVSWTNAMKSKKSQKQYWSLFKKHGTSFGLSGERLVATQVG